MPYKILMLHGYTQSGPLFDAKTKALQKHLQKSFPGTTFSYPTGPLRLKPADVPGFNSSRFEGDENDVDAIESYGWWRRSNTADPPEYVGIENGLQVVAETLESEGPFDGVMGFSQGAAFAAVVSSLLEGKRRKQAFDHFQNQSKMAVAFPEMFAKSQHPPMKFCVSYSGFIAPGARYTALYEPTIDTPSCHFIGSLDSVMEESRCRALLEAFGGERKAQLVFHPGGHFTPSAKPYLAALEAFIRNSMEGQGKENGIDDEKAEDMDVPF